MEPIVLVLAALILTGLAYFFPLPTMVTALSWVVLVRQGQELLVTNLVGITLTEVDILVGASLVAGASMALHQYGRGRALAEGRRFDRQLALAVLAWPLWLAIRAALPTVGESSGSPWLDLRIIVPLTAILPVLCLVRARGGLFLTKWILLLAYASAIIAVGARIALALGLVHEGSGPLVLIDSVPTVRPGGETLVPVAAALLASGRAPRLSIGPVTIPSALGWVLILAELLISQTLTIVLGTGVGVFLAFILTWRESSRVRKAAALAVVAIALIVVVTGAFGSDSRFNLAARMGEDSAGYRFTELAQVREDVFASGASALFGPGPGSVIAVDNPFTFGVDVKRDSHNVYASVALKTGLAGVALFLLPALLVTVRALRGSPPVNRALVGATGGVLFLSIAVPFIWTPQGAVAYLMLVAAAGTHDAPAAEHPTRVQRRSGANARRSQGS